MAALALILALSSPGAAAAQAAREQARTLFLEGNKLHDAGDFAGALEKFREARRLFPSYKIDLNIANTLDKMGRPVDAAEAFQRFLEHAPASAPAIMVTGARRRLEALRSRVASVEVSCAVPAARVTVDDKPMGETPRTGRRYLSPGAHRLEVRRQGYALYGAQIALSAGDHRAIQVELTPLQTVGRAAPGTGAPTEGGGRRRIWAYATLGLGVALAAGAVTLYGLAKSQGDEAHQRYLEARDPDTIVERWQDVEAARTKATVGHVLVGAAAAAVGVSVYLFLSGSGTGEGGGGQRPPGPGGALVSWSF